MRKIYEKWRPGRCLAKVAIVPPGLSFRIYKTYSGIASAFHFLWIWIFFSVVIKRIREKVDREIRYWNL